MHALCTCRQRAFSLSSGIQFCNTMSRMLQTPSLLHQYHAHQFQFSLTVWYHRRSVSMLRKQWDPSFDRTGAENNDEGSSNSLLSCIHLFGEYSLWYICRKLKVLS